MKGVAFPLFWEVHRKAKAEQACMYEDLAPAYGLDMEALQW